MSQMRVLTDDEAAKCCTMPQAIDAMTMAFQSLSNGQANVPVRTNLRATPHTESLIMPVALDSLQYFGLKAVSLTDDNLKRSLPRIHAAIMLFDSETGQPAGLINAEYVTALRTGAASGLATRILSPPSAKHLVVFGTGKQARFQALAVSTVREFETITVVGRNLKNTQLFCEGLSSQCGGQEVIATTDPHAVSNADVICTATSSRVPLFSPEFLPDVCHVNAIGSYRPDMVELALELMPRFTIVVDQRKACLEEAGEIVQATNRGYLSADSTIHELGEILKSPPLDRRRTLFKSVGNAIQDLVVANIIMQKALETNLGLTISI